MIQRKLELPRFETSAAEIRMLGQKTLEMSKNEVARLGGLNPETVDFQSSIVALDSLEFEESSALGRIYLLQNVSPDEEVRKAAQEVYLEFQDWAVEKSYNKGLFKLVQRVAARKMSLNKEEKKLLDDYLNDFRRLGLHLPEEKQSQLKVLQKKLSAIESAFSQAINEYEDFVVVDQKDLTGLDADFISSLDKDPSGKLQVSLQYPEYLPVMEFCSNEKVRKELLIRKYRVAEKSNVSRLNEMILIRDEIAQTLGYSSFNDYVIEDRMAKTPERVRDFLKSFEKRLREKATKELAALEALKQFETSDAAARLEIWDFSFYSALYKKKNFSVDLNELKDFFPLEKVLQGMLKVMGKVFSIRFEEQKPGFPTWHSDVRLFNAYDEKTSESMGAFYLDLFPRPGKYGHAAAFGLVDGKEKESGVYQAPVECMVCNFPPQAPHSLSHSEVETLFHEFGHILHGLLTTSRYSRFSGTSVAWDFVEAPSQVLENWCWDHEILNQIAENVKDPSRKISKEFVEKMNQAQKAGVALFYLRQVAFAKADLEFHETGKQKDSTAIMNRIMAETFMPPPPQTSFQAGWGHMVGYASGYYGYAWADVMAADIFSFFKKSGLLDADQGRRLRAEIYAPGSSREELESLEKFLGRPLSDEAFFEQLGL